MIKGIHVTYIHTPHKELSQWYEKVLGLKKNYSDDHWHDFVLDDGSRLGLDFTSFPRSVVEKQPIVISFKVDDIHKVVEKLGSRGVKFYPSLEKTIFDAGPTLVATFQDPDGNWVQLSQDK